ncbi:AAA family ATPase [Planktothrix pseudagardhii]|uniref:Endonuclease GajA/Old nuclease/RecF-like AAA domain-containing protein n=1 Tax=Planktothrix pseudagardhii TaxID=132604 RepID=A0A9W4G9R1_9CYAN|nr:AAA family ATPase [Planktothrix pseudagardhii]CAD5976667.1 hypothetical protein NO713_04225 [Planktothrix pseudagardhii]
MHLVRVQVPNFRALNQVDITFEKDFFPKIFPLGSQNGGGKSTLLQLIFVLLHCSGNPEQFDFLKNLLLDFKIPEGSESRTLAEIDVDDNGNMIRLIFRCRRYRVLTLSNIVERGGTYKTVEQGTYESDDQNNVIPIFKYREDDIYFINSHYPPNAIFVCETNNISNINNNLKNESTENKKKDSISILEQKLQNFSLSKISEKIFMVAPSTQVFLFLPPTTRKLLFRQTDHDNPDYYSELNSAKSKLNNFFTYDFLAVEVLIDYFKFVRDQDFREAIKTGHYGNHYKSLLQELNQVLIDKKINLTEDFEGVTFELQKNGKIIKLNPEDLSHGELKRLTIYALLKYYEIKDAIVLMDEIEIALHPDWQYQIISDLEQWEPSNQYILATHSYELCQALTPAHVKEIEPKLIKNKD